MSKLETQLGLFFMHHFFKNTTQHYLFPTLIALAWFGMFSLSSTANAETVRVYVEDSTPLINEQGEPLGIIILEAIEDISELKFEFTHSTYARALLNLKDNKADMLLHVPYKAEPSFDEYGIYLDWSVPVKADLYSLDPQKFKNLSRLEPKSIALPRGHTQFASHVTGIPKEAFYEVNSMTSIVKMLAARRVDLIWFDRVSTQQELRKQNIPTIYYYEIPVFNKVGSIGIGLQKTEKGLRLKNTIDALITKIDTKTILAPYLERLNLELPQTGKIEFQP